MNMHIHMKDYNFSNGQLDAIKLGKDLVKRQLYSQDKETYSKYQSFSNIDISLEDHEMAFLNLMKEAAYNKSGKDPEKITDVEAVDYQDWRRAMFSVIESVIDSLNAKNEVEDILTFVELRNIALGDSILVDIKNPNAYVFSNVSRGKKNTFIQRRYGENVTISPTPHQITISYNLKDIVTGRVEIGREMARMVRGMRTAWLRELSTLVFSTTVNPINNKVISTGSFTESSFRTFEQKISAYNGSRNTVVYGTRTALGNLLPSVNLRYQLGQEYMDRGYISTAFGTRAIELYQAVTPESTPSGGASNITLILPENYVIISSTDVQRPVILGLGGGTRVTEENEQNTATQDRNITINQDYDLKLASQGIIGVFRTDA